MATPGGLYARSAPCVQFGRRALWSNQRITDDHRNVYGCKYSVIVEVASDPNRQRITVIHSNQQIAQEIDGPCSVRRIEPEDLPGSCASTSPLDIVEIAARPAAGTVYGLLVVTSGVVLVGLALLVVTIVLMIYSEMRPMDVQLDAERLQVDGGLTRSLLSREDGPIILRLSDVSRTRAFAESLWVHSPQPCATSREREATEPTPLLPPFREQRRMMAADAR